MSPLPFPTVPPRCALVAGSLDDARAYAKEKRLTSWFYVQSAPDLDGFAGEPIRVEYVGMGWRKRPDRDEIAAAIEVLRETGRLR